MGKILNVLLILVTFYCVIRVFICDSFVVSGASMEPIFHDGQRVLAFKPGIGARIYTKYDFSETVLHSFRMPGFKRLKRGDIAVFNHPYGIYQDEINFRINHVLIKRCAGAPGDTVLVEGIDPFVVPRRGDRIILDSCTRNQFRNQIEFETGKKMSLRGNGTIILEDEPVTDYLFTSDWYYFIGDNLSVSQDSRHFGLVPESFIVGRVNGGGTKEDFDY